MSEKDWDRISQPWDSFLFNGLAVNVSVSTIIYHLAMLERYIIDAVGSMENCAVLSDEGDIALCERKGDHQELLSCYQTVHEENLGKLLALEKSDLEKN